MFKEEFTIILPGVEIPQRVTSGDKAKPIKRPAAGQGIQGFDRKGTALAFQLPGRGEQPLVLLKRQDRHGMAMIGATDGLLVLVGRNIGHHEPDLIERKHLSQPKPYMDMPGVDGIEAPSQDSDLQA